jgi:hypothetical protein
MRRRRILVTLSLTAATAMPLGVAPASAIGSDSIPYLYTAAAFQPQGYSDCPVGKICVWTGTAATGLHSELYAVGSGSCSATILRGYSAYNRTQVTQLLYSNSNCTSVPLVLRSGQAIDNTGARRSVGGYP